MHTSLCGLNLIVDSDILAELDIPPSGIQEVAEEVPYPKLNIDTAGAVNGEVGRPDIMQYYQFQLYLRRRLNEIQKELYKESRWSFHLKCSVIP